MSDTYVSDTLRAVELLEFVNIQIHSDYREDWSGKKGRSVYIHIKFERDNRRIEFSRAFPDGVSAGDALREAWEAFSTMLFASVPKADYTPALLAQDVF